jgi:hypothetical protein
MNNQIENEIALITALIKHHAGYAVDLFGGLICIRSTDQNTFEVEWDIRCIDGNENLESKIDYLSFSNAEEAAKCFVEKRHEFKLGVDFEMKYYMED